MASAPLERPRRSTIPVAFACVVTLTLVLAACGGGGSEKASGVASLSGGASSTTTPSSKSSTDTRQLWLDAAACMRKQGVDFPDPTFDANGRPQFNQSGQSGQGGPGSVFRSDDPKIQAARKACQSDFDKIRSSFPAPTPAEAAQRKQQILALAACMREQGVDFPDPTFDANGRPTFGQGQGGQPGGADGAARRNDPAFQKAMQTCRTKLGVTFGRGPGGRGPGGGGGNGSTTPTTTGNA